MRRRKLLVSGSLALILAASLLAAMPVWASEEQLVTTNADPFFRSFNRHTAGVYLVTGVPPEGPPFLMLFNIYREGLFSVSSQVQGTTLSGFAFTDDQGIWKRTRRRQFTAKLLSFNYLPPGGEYPSGGLHSNGIAYIRADLSEDFSTVSGTFSVTLFAPDVNPLNPDAEPLGPPLAILFEGERLTIP